MPRFLLKQFGPLFCLSAALFTAKHEAVAAPPIALISPTNAWKYNDESIDLGTDWIAPGYNDSAWSNSFAAIGFRANSNASLQLPPPNVLRSVYSVTNFVTNMILVTNMTEVTTNTVVTTNVTVYPSIRKNTPTNSLKNILTFYFRAHFTVTNDPSGAVLTASNLIDDGAVFYLNGRELARVGMPPGTVHWDTLATRGDDVGTNRTPAVNTHGYDVFAVPLDALVPGENVAAVEVHQANSGSTDMAFQMELWATYPDATQLSITNEPQDAIVEEAKSVSLRAGVSGDGGHYQWYQQGVGAVPGAIGSTYFIASTSTNDSGFYFLIVSNAVNSVTSRVAQLTVLSDTFAPVLIDADGSSSTTNVLVSFSEPILPPTATNAANYKIINTIGGALIVTSAVLNNATNVSLTTSTGRVANNNYILIVNNVRDTSPRTNLVAANSRVPISNLGTIIDWGSDGWRFFDPVPPFDLPDLGTAWREVIYDDSIWGDGAGVFFNGADPTTVPGPVGTRLSQSDAVISYFRYTFSSLSVSPGIQRLFLTHIIDDGAILYLNGTEIFRTNLPSGAVNYQTRASTTVSSPTRVGPLALTGTFRQGTNVFAAELHQDRAPDFDKIFGIRLDAYVRSVAVGPAIITGGPYDVTVFEGQSATFQVVDAGGTAYQWQQNSNDITGANDDSYTAPAVPMSLNGARFRVFVTGADGTVVSTNATLRVLPDTNAPTLVAAFASSNSIVVSFSENMGATSANNAANYLVTNAIGQSFTATGASLTNGTSVMLSFAALPPGTYFVVVNNVRDASVAGNVIAPNSTVRAGFAAQVQNLTGPWSYNQANTNLGTAWSARTYDDSSWPSGTALFNGKYNAAVPSLPATPGTVLDVRRPSNNTTNIPTYYFRTHFNSFSSGSGNISIRLVADDGCAIYLNGVEIYRLGLPAGTVTFGTFASRTVGDANDSPPLEGIFTVPVTNVLAGDNIIAVEVHQSSATSSDVYWGGEFSLLIPSTRLTASNQPPACTNIALTLPTLRHQRISGTDVVLSWTNPATNTCGSNAVFTLQQTLLVSNPPSSSVWSDVTTVSPYTAVGTNRARFFRLKQ